MSVRFARWLCRRCLPVVCAPTPALGCVALAHARSRRKSVALEGWDRMRPLGRWSDAVASRSRKGHRPAQGNPNSMPQNWASSKSRANWVHTVTPAVLTRQ
ncbi:hypothetical protein CIW52_29625 [Mycolicibacterium sp. P9-64]|nr:hypothetical protein CIW52_29625 [Mycolicibacterium sp. P9-64]